MKNLLEHLRESLLEGKEFTKEELSKDVAETFYKVFGDNIEPTEDPYNVGPDFEITDIDLEPVSSNDKSVIIDNRKKILKVIWPKLKEFQKELGKKYNFRIETEIKKPIKDCYCQLLLFIENDIVDWDTNWKTIGIRGFYTYDSTQKKVLNSFNISSRDLDTLNKYLER